VVLFELDLY